MNVKDGVKDGVKGLLLTKIEAARARKKDRVQLFNDDCLNALKLLPANSVDSLVCDPPAGISFMGKAWDDDKGGRDEWISWLAEVMRECLRVMKPGAHGLVWSLPRTSHWTATALENAGFEVRDCVTHLFGSGFPKSMDISKAIDKAAGAERKVIGSKIAGGFNRGQYSNENFGNVHTPDSGYITAPTTAEAKQWEGWGTALKPAAEFWWLVRKPLSEKTVAKNVLRWETGGINIDGSRIGTAADKPARTVSDRDGRQAHGFMQGIGADLSAQLAINSKGRFPANLLLSHSPSCTEDACDTSECAVAILDAQSGASKSIAGDPEKQYIRPQKNTFGKQYADNKYASSQRTDSGGASRFFYVAKISSSERNAGLDNFEVKSTCEHERRTGQNNSPIRPDGSARKPALAKNNHPTVKPKKLMSYLINLITPPGGTVIDCFMGSGSTGIAAVEGGWKFIGIEREKEYFEIARARIEAASNGRS